MTAGFYDALADDYHLMFVDWDGAMKRQGDWLDHFIRTEWPGSARLLDATCGVGTQSIPLALRGYEVTASDLSPAAVARAGREASARGARLTTSVADLRSLSKTHGEFDVVLACDNSFPHLLSDAEIAQGLAECGACVRPGGGFLLSMRDYDAPGTGSEMHSYGVRPLADGRALLFQVWDWDGAHYDLSFYVVKERAGGVETSVQRSRYYAIAPARVLELMRAAGFENVRRVEGFVQPVLVGTRRT